MHLWPKLILLIFLSFNEIENFFAEKLINAQPIDVPIGSVFVGQLADASGNGPNFFLSTASTIISSSTSNNQISNIPIAPSNNNQQFSSSQQISVAISSPISIAATSPVSNAISSTISSVMSSPVSSEITSVTSSVASSEVSSAQSRAQSSSESSILTSPISSAVSSAMSSGLSLAISSADSKAQSSALSSTFSSSLSVTSSNIILSSETESSTADSGNQNPASTSATNVVPNSTASGVSNKPVSGTTQTSPSTGVCPAIQFIQTPTNSDVTFTAQTTRSIAWVDVHINVLNGNQTPYPSNAPVENNSWFWNYRMTKVSDKTFNFQYTTGPNGFNFDPSKQSLQYFFTYSSDLADCNTQSFIYSPSNLVSPSIGALVSNINQPQTATTPTNNGVCPVFSFNYNVFPVDSTYEVDFAPQTTRTVEFVDIHFNVLSIGQSPYPANAIVEANNWFWNYRMNKVNDNLFTFKLPTGQNGVNFDSSKSLQFFFTYCTEEIDCNTQSFVFNTNSGALEAPPAPQPQLPSQQTGNQEQSQQTAQQQQPSSSQPNNQHSQQNYNNQNQTPPPTTPPTQNGLTFCEKYSQQLFSNSQSDCYQTALFAGIVNRAVYGSSNVNPSVTGAYAQASPVWNFFNGSIPYNGQQYQLQQLINHSNNNDKFGPILTQTLIEFMGRLFGCKSSGFPAFSSNPDFANSGYTYPDINALRNVIKGLNLPKSFYDSINTSIIQSMKSFGVSDDDINSIVIPTISGFENGLIGQSVYQQSKVTEDHNNNNQKESSAVTKYLVSISMIALPAVMALLF